MAIEKVGETIPGVAAGADLTGNQYHCVAIDSNGAAVLAGDGARVDAVLQNKPNVDEAATLWSSGSVTKVEAAAAIAAGDPVSSAADGRGNPATSGDFVLGPALDAAGAAGELLSVALTFPGVLP